MSIRNEENVMGSIYLRKDGRYEGRCKDNKGDKTFYFYGKNYDEVYDKMNSFWESQSYCQSDLTVKKLFEECLEAIKFRIKQSTLANYFGKAEIHIIPAFGSIRADELDASHVQQFIADKLSAGLSPNYFRFQNNPAHKVAKLHTVGYNRTKKHFLRQGNTDS